MNILTNFEIYLLPANGNFEGRDAPFLQIKYGSELIRREHFCDIQGIARFVYVYYTCGIH